MSIVAIFGLLAYLCPPTSATRSRSLLAQEEEWFYVRRYSVPKEVILLNFDVLRLGVVHTGQHALVIEEESGVRICLFDYGTMDPHLMNQTLIMISRKAIDAFVFVMRNHDMSARDGFVAPSANDQLIQVPTALESYQLHTNQSFHAERCQSAVEAILSDYSGLCVEYRCGTMTLYKPGISVPQDRVKQAIQIAKQLYSVFINH